MEPDDRDLEAADQEHCSGEDVAVQYGNQALDVRLELGAGSHKTVEIHVEAQGADDIKQTLQAVVDLIPNLLDRLA